MGEIVEGIAVIGITGLVDWIAFKVMDGTLCGTRYRFAQATRAW